MENPIVKSVAIVLFIWYSIFFLFSKVSVIYFFNFLGTGLIWIISGVVIGVCIYLLLFYFSSSYTKYNLQPRKYRGASISIGNFLIPEYNFKINSIPDSFFSSIKNWDDIKKNNPIYARCFIDAARIYLASKDTPAGKKLGDHNDASLIEHTNNVVQSMIKHMKSFEYVNSNGIAYKFEDDDLLPILAAFVHDIGKTICFKKTKGVFEEVLPDHGRVGSGILRSIESFKCLPNRDGQLLFLAVQYYHEMHNYPLSGWIPVRGKALVEILAQADIMAGEYEQKIWDSNNAPKALPKLVHLPIERSSFIRPEQFSSQLGISADNFESSQEQLGNSFINKDWSLKEIHRVADKELQSFGIVLVRALLFEDQKKSLIGKILFKYKDFYILDKEGIEGILLEKTDGVLRFLDATGFLKKENGDLCIKDYKLAFFKVEFKISGEEKILEKAVIFNYKLFIENEGDFLDTISSFEIIKFSFPKHATLINAKKPEKENPSEQPQTETTTPPQPEQPIEPVIAKQTETTTPPQPEQPIEPVIAKQTETTTPPQPESEPDVFTGIHAEEVDDLLLSSIEDKFDGAEANDTPPTPAIQSLTNKEASSDDVPQVMSEEAAVGHSSDFVTHKQLDAGSEQQHRNSAPSGKETPKPKPALNENDEVWHIPSADLLYLNKIAKKASTLEKSQIVSDIFLFLTKKEFSPFSTRDAVRNGDSIFFCVDAFTKYLREKHLETPPSKELIIESIYECGLSSYSQLLDIRFDGIDYSGFSEVRDSSWPCIEQISQKSVEIVSSISEKSEIDNLWNPLIKKENILFFRSIIYKNDGKIHQHFFSHLFRFLIDKDIAPFNNQICFKSGNVIYFDIFKIIEKMPPYKEEDKEIVIKKYKALDILNLSGLLVKKIGDLEVEPKKAVWILDIDGAIFHGFVAITTDEKWPMLDEHIQDTVDLKVLGQDGLTPISNENFYEAYTRNIVKGTDGKILLIQINGVTIYGVASSEFHKIYIDRNHIPDGFIIFTEDGVEYIGVEESVIIGMKNYQKMTRKI